MKYLAILKDSLRETIDGKVFLAMIGLSLLAMLATAQLSFTPEPAEKAVQSMPNLFNLMLRGQLGRNAPSIGVENFEELDPDKRPWEGRYRFRVVATDGENFPFRAMVFFGDAFAGAGPGQKQTEQGRRDREELQQIMVEASRKPEIERNEFMNKRLREKLEQVSPKQMEEFVQRLYAQLGNLEVTSVKLADEKRDKVTLFDVEARAKENTFNLWPHSLGVFFGAKDLGYNMPIGPLVMLIETQIVGTLGASIFLLVSSIMTSFFIPNMLRKGAVDLLISKPIRRWVLLIYKYVGGMLFMFLNTVVLIGGFWLVMGLRTGLWAPSFLLMIPILTFQFAIYYAVSTLAAMLTRNTIVAIMATCFAWLVLFLTGVSYKVSKPDAGQEPSSFHRVMKVAHAAMPRISDLDNLSQYVVTIDLLQSDSEQRKALYKPIEDTSWVESIGVSVAWIGLLLGISCWWFSTKDY